MLKFAVFDNDQPARAWPLAHAHLIGPERLVLPGEVSFENGQIVCVKKTDGGAGAAGLALLWPIAPVEGIGGMGGGVAVLQTCLLPQRTEPYLLSLELARQKVMTLFNKLEEWALFDMQASEPMMVMIEKARVAFTAALLASRRRGSGGSAYTAEADALARKALGVAIAAGESLSLVNAKVQHARRCSGEMRELAQVKVPSSALTDDEAREARGAMVGSAGVVLPEMPKIGVRVQPAVFNPAICDQIAANFDFVSIPMRWVEMEPSEGKYAFAKFDKWIEWAVTKAKMPVHAGAVIDLHPRAVPDWLSIWEHDYETLRDVIFEHVKNIVTRYRRTVNVWTICSSLNVGGTFKLTYEQAIDLTRSCVAIVRKLQPGAKVHVEIAQAFGEHVAGPRGGKSIPPALYCELMNQTQTGADAYAVRLQLGQHETGRAMRTIVGISNVLDKLAAAEKPIAVSVFGCPSRAATVEELPLAAADGSLTPGYWRTTAGGWTPESQADFATHLASVIGGKPYVQSLCWHEIIDAPMAGGAGLGEMPGGGLFTQQGQPKPVLKALANVRAALKEGKPLPGTLRV